MLFWFLRKNPPGSDRVFMCFIFVEALIFKSVVYK